MIDFKNMKKLSIGGIELKQLLINGVQVWKSGYKNLLPSAKDTDRKTIYQGKGYITGYRLSSSGSISPAGGMCASGFILVKVGDTIRIKGITPKDGAASYIIAYNSSNTKTGYITIPQENGAWATYNNVTYSNGVIKIKLTTTDFGSGFDAIRFSAGVIDGNTIVTIDEDIT